MTIEMQKVTLYKGDCRDCMKEMLDNGICVDLTVCSPPYDDLRTYNDDSTWNFGIFQEVAKGLYDVTRKGGVVVWVVADQTKNGGRTLTSFRQALYFQEIGFTFCDDIIFSKNSPAFPPKRDSKRYGNIYEHMFVLSNGKIRNDITLIADKPNKWYGKGSWGKCNNYGKDGTLIEGKKVTDIPEFSLRNNIWEYAVGINRDKEFGKHPAVFPEKLAEDHIRSWSNEGDTVFDPFMGSGTTGKCAVLNGRNFIGSEISEMYYDMSTKRIGKYFDGEIEEGL